MSLVTIIVLLFPWLVPISALRNTLSELQIPVRQGINGSINICQEITCIRSIYTGHFCVDFSFCCLLKYMRSLSLEQNSGCICRQAFIHYCGLHQVWGRTEKLCLVWVLRDSMSMCYVGQYGGRELEISHRFYLSF